MIDKPEGSYRLDYWNEYDEAAAAYMLAGEITVVVNPLPKLDAAKKNLLYFGFCIDSAQT